MSNEVFPALPGLSWGTEKTPVWATNVYEAEAGFEQRVQLWSYPRWRFKLQYEVLREASGFSEVQSLMGFFNRHAGMGDSFLYEDPTDNSAANEPIATGDGTTKSFQLMHTYGGFSFPIKNIKALAEVRVGGVVTAASLNSTGVITFVTAPASGAAITATFTFYYRCRFDLDALPFATIAKLLWENRQVDMVSLK